MSKKIEKLIEVMIGINLICVGGWVFSLFGSLNYCWTTDLEINPNPLLSLCLFWNLTIPLLFIIAGISLIIFKEGGKND